jgi:hypothetical protein
MSKEQVENYLRVADEQATKQREAEVAYYRNTIMAAKVAIPLIANERMTEEMEEHVESLSKGVALCERYLDELREGFSHEYQYYGTLGELENEMASLRSALEEIFDDDE